jgi:hypothetical protein
MPAPVTNAVTICNSALLKIGADTITSLSQNTRPAIICNTLYAYLRDEVMGSSPWRFALSRAVLNPNANVPPWGEYTTCYDLPSDCLRPLLAETEEQPWTQEGQQLLSMETVALNIKYIYRNTDESTWDARFCEAFAWRLAMELALGLTQSIPMKQEAEKSYNNSLAQARSMNAVIGTLTPTIADQWTQARRGYHNWRPTVGQAGDP